VRQRRTGRDGERIGIERRFGLQPSADQSVDGFGARRDAVVEAIGVDLVEQIAGQRDMAAGHLSDSSTRRAVNVGLRHRGNVDLR